MPIDRLREDPRVTVRRGGEPAAEGAVVVYWMRRAQRAVDNPALETAIAAANAMDKPLVVFFSLTLGVERANLRHYQFMMEGLAEVATDLERRGIPLVLRHGPEHDVPQFCHEVRAALLIGDENPLRGAEAHTERVAARVCVPFWTVDADVIVPSRLMGRAHFAARTIRPHIRAQLPRFLQPVQRQDLRRRWKVPPRLHRLPVHAGVLDDMPLDRSAEPAPAFRGGSQAALAVLRRFLAQRLPRYAEWRNRPERDGTSQLSPYLHFGQIGPHTVALAVRDANAPAAARDRFLEELIVRRELAVNFVRYNSDYDRVSCAEPWARRTLAMHRSDPRLYRYTPRQLEEADTHDVLWNAAQRQMVYTGWMHGYLRMYWAKKILEWSESAEAAYEIAVNLNDRYELDGRDPNGYAGIAWAIAGKHDRAWGPERPIFGTIRYMSYAGTSRKFDSAAYIARVERLVAERGVCA